MTGEKFQRLVEIMARLRGPDGCPWDREQTFDTIKSYLLEETYEVIDAIDRKDWDELASELGDLQLQVVFFAQMATEESRFAIDDVLDRIADKLVRRHPHVFGGESATTAVQVLKRWNELKAAEKGEGARGLLDNVPRSLPALLEAYQLSTRAAQVGFDWQRFEGMLEKLREEAAELEQARQGPADPQRTEEEIGDLLFMLVNIARFLKFDPEMALRKTNRKFRERFAQVEQGLEERGKTPAQAGLEEMEELWQQAKRKQRSQSGR